MSVDLKIYVRAVTRRCEFRWYSLNGLLTTAYGPDWEPDAWTLCGQLLVDTKPCVALVSQKQNLSCIFTGLLSYRSDESWRIYDTVIIESSGELLSETQKDLLKLFLLSEQGASSLNMLTRAIEDIGQEGIAINAYKLHENLTYLSGEGSKLRANAKRGLPNNIVKDSPESRNAFVFSTENYRKTFFDESRVIAVATKNKSPEIIGLRVDWGITDHSAALPFCPEPPLEEQQSTEQEAKQEKTQRKTNDAAFYTDAEKENSDHLISGVISGVSSTLATGNLLVGLITGIVSGAAVKYLARPIKAIMNPLIGKSKSRKH